MKTAATKFSYTVTGKIGGVDQGKRVIKTRSVSDAATIYALDVIGGDRKATHAALYNWDYALSAFVAYGMCGELSDGDSYEVDAVLTSHVAAA